MTIPSHLGNKSGKHKKSAQLVDNGHELGICFTVNTIPIQSYLYFSVF